MILPLPKTASTTLPYNPPSNIPLIDLYTTPENSKKRKEVDLFKPPNKKKDSELYRHVTILPLPCGGVSVNCNHCPKFNKIKIQKFNPTKFRLHLTNVCQGIGKDTKRLLLQGTQANRGNGDLFTFQAEGTVEDMQADALMSPLTQTSGPSLPPFDLTSRSVSSKPAAKPKSKRKASTLNSKAKKDGTQQSIGFPVMSQAEADKIIKRKVKTALARGETLGRLLDDHMRAEMIGDFPAIAFFLPRDESTVFSKYAIPIDFESQEELKNFIMKLSGLINIAMDGATCNGKQKVSHFSNSACFLISKISHLYSLCTDCLYFV